MVDALLDTNVLVDIMRGREASGVWMRANESLRLGVSPIVWMELVAGAPNKVSQAQCISLLNRFEMVYLTWADMDWAMARLAEYQLSHNAGMADCLIAAPSHRLSIPLYTGNLKHFTPLLGALVEKPY